MNRAERRAAAKNGKWADVPANLRRLSELDKVLSMEDRRRLAEAAGKIEAGDRPLVVMASISDVLGRVKRASTGPMVKVRKGRR